MLIYFTIYILILLAPMHPVIDREGYLLSYNARLPYMLGLITLMFALRHQSMGVDLGYYSSNGYLESFERITSYSWIQVLKLGSFLNYEKGYIIYNKLISIVSRDPQWLLMCTAIITMVLLGFCIYKNSIDYRFSILVFLGMPVFHMYFSGLRQALAISICYFATNLIRDKKIMRFVLCVALATLFHYTAFIFIVAYPLYWMRLDRKKRLISIPILLGVFIFKNPLFSILARLFRNDASTEATGAGMLFFIFMAIYIFCTLFIQEDDEIALGFLNLFYVACICQAFSGIYSVAMRVGYYFMIGIIIALPNIVCRIQNENSYRISKLAIPTIFVLYGLYSVFISSWSMAYPYHFFWEVI